MLRRKPWNHLLLPTRPITTSASAAPLDPLARLIASAPLSAAGPLAGGLLRKLLSSDKPYTAQDLYEITVLSVSAVGTDPSVLNCMVVCYSRLGKLVQSKICLDRITKLGATPSKQAYDTLLCAFCVRRELCDALRLFWRACEIGVFPTYTNYLCLIEGLCGEQKWGEGLDVFEVMLMTEARNQLHLCKSLVHRLCKSGRAEDAESLCNEVWSRGLQLYPVMCNWLVHAYCKMSKLEKAAAVLGRMHEMGCSPEVYAYNVLIQECLRAGKKDMAFEVFRRMGGNGLCPDIITYCILRKFSVIPKLKGKGPIFGLKIIQDWAKDGFLDMDAMKSFSTVISEQEVELLFDQVVGCDIVASELALDYLINGFCEEGNVHSAFFLLEKMVSDGLKPLVYTYNCVISCLVKVNLLRSAEMLIKHMQKHKHNKSVPPNSVTYLILINAYCKLGDVGSALLLFNEMVEGRIEPSVAIYDALINSMCKAKRIQEAEFLFRRMEKVGIMADVIVYTAMIGGFARNGRALKACALFEDMKNKGFQPTNHIYSALINGFMKCNMVEKGCEYIGKMLKDGFLPDTALYTSLINQFSRKGEHKFALNLVKLMSANGEMPNLKTYCSLITGICRNMRCEHVRDPQLTRRLVNAEHVLSNLLPQKTVMPVQLTPSSPCTFSVKQLISSIQREVDCSRLERDLHFYNVIITVSCRNNSMKDAYDAVNSMKKDGLMPNQVTYTILINHHISLGEVDRSIELFNHMNASGSVPDVITYSSIMRALCERDRVVEALSVAYLMHKRGLVPSRTSLQILIYSLCIMVLSDNYPKKMGLSDIAFKVFRDMLLHGSIPSSSTCDRLLYVIYQYNILKEADQVFSIMVKRGKRLRYQPKR